MSFGFHTSLSPFLPFLVIVSSLEGGKASPTKRLTMTGRGRTQGIRQSVILRPGYHILISWIGASLDTTLKKNRPHTNPLPEKVANRKGNGTLISGKSRLVKYFFCYQQTNRNFFWTLPSITWTRQMIFSSLCLASACHASENKTCVN